MLPLTGTTNRQHMTDDLAAERFSLTEEEVERIEMIDCLSLSANRSGG
jgi:diketogulonate reductase-like aldo/keto reductase